jgi:hypothetical protein
MNAWIRCDIISIIKNSRLVSKRHYCRTQYQWAKPQWHLSRQLLATAVDPDKHWDSRKGAIAQAAVNSLYASGSFRGSSIARLVWGRKVISATT